MHRRVSFGVHKTIAAGPLSTAIDQPAKTTVADSHEPGGNKRYYFKQQQQQRLVRLFRYIQRSCIHHWQPRLVGRGGVGRKIDSVRAGRRARVRAGRVLAVDVRTRRPASSCRARGLSCQQWFYRIATVQQ